MKKIIIAIAVILLIATPFILKGNKNSKVEYLYAPRLINRSPSIKYLKNAKELMRNKHFLPERFMDGLEKE